MNFGKCPSFGHFPFFIPIDSEDLKIFPFIPLRRLRILIFRAASEQLMLYTHILEYRKQSDGKGKQKWMNEKPGIAFCTADVWRII